MVVIADFFSHISIRHGVAMKTHPALGPKRIDRREGVKSIFGMPYMYIRKCNKFLPTHGCGLVFRRKSKRDALLLDGFLRK